MLTGYDYYKSDVPLYRPQFTSSILCVPVSIHISFKIWQPYSMITYVYSPDSDYSIKFICKMNKIDWGPIFYACNFNILYCRVKQTGTYFKSEYFVIVVIRF